MHVDTCTYQRGDKTYTRHLLRESYRAQGKVLKRTIANLSHCSDAEIAAIKLALQHKENLVELGTLEDLKLTPGTRLGAVFALNALAERFGLPAALGRDRQGRLALWQVLARLIDQGSRLSAVRLAERHGAPDLLGLDAFHEDDLYRNLAWLCDNQDQIEQRLFQARAPRLAAPQLFLYDVTSSYFEGVDNALAAYGYNRDGKLGKMQIVIGLLCDATGEPVAVRVFDGNTQDTATVPEQIRALAEQFGAQHVTLVGDKGMLKGPQIKQLGEAEFNYITSLSKPEIRTLLATGALQLTLFDEQVMEAADEAAGLRYVVRRNPVRAAEVRRNRRERVWQVGETAVAKNEYLAKSVRRQAEVALRQVREKIARYKLKGILEVELRDRQISVSLNAAALDDAETLDGCYVIKTDLPIAVADRHTVHDRYRDLAKVEHAFRTFKNGHLETRPIFVRTEKSTRGHVLVVMLAYLIERRLAELWRGLECTVPEGIDELGSLRGTIIEINGVSCQRVPQPAKPDLAAELLEAAKIKLPPVLPLRGVHVVTRKKLVDER